eukprot:gnl/Dysnectes_brevis/644_a711_7255.p1 GENE.gnl/Dysnectes_brevis/644_a711_7255~~gnl/Dysnectes_brevis/644_a711_7255.p1  ORF type:complete len:170 (+),score=22.14 gnl/Dysnectes_brevis/644_a711_7255:21-530(+)
MGDSIVCSCKPCGSIRVGFSFSKLLVSLFGSLFPVYRSMHSLKSKGKNDDTQWLTYWVIWSLFNVFEKFADRLIYWVPFYLEIKLAFVLWLSLPQTMGAQVIYNKYVDPFFKKHKGSLDEMIKSIALKISQKAGGFIGIGVQKALHIVSGTKSDDKKKVVEDASEEDDE